jgi:hypothetical protein
MNATEVIVESGMVLTDIRARCRSQRPKGFGWRGSNHCSRDGGDGIGTSGTMGCHGVWKSWKSARFLSVFGLCS